jgi:hypothetical protein
MNMNPGPEFDPKAPDGVASWVHPGGQKIVVATSGPLKAKEYTASSPLPEPGPTKYGQKDMVNLPAHYARFQIEPMRFIAENGLNWFQGNIIKYICRWDAKDGRQDLRKAARYLQMWQLFLDGNPDWWRASKHPDERIDELERQLADTLAKNVYLQQEIAKLNKELASAKDTNAKLVVSKEMAGTTQRWAVGLAGVGRHENAGHYDRMELDEAGVPLV